MYVSTGPKRKTKIADRKRIQPSFVNRKESSRLGFFSILYCLSVEIQEGTPSQTKTDKTAGGRGLEKIYSVAPFPQSQTLRCIFATPNSSRGGFQDVQKPAVTWLGSYNAAAPEMISISSLVMTACLVLLKIRVSFSIISPAFLVALSMALIRELCSLHAFSFMA